MVESTALEMRRTGNRTVGSNPTLSANLLDPRASPERPPRDSGRLFPESRAIQFHAHLRVPIRDVPGALFCRIANTLEADVPSPINVAIKQVLSISGTAQPCRAIQPTQEYPTNMTSYYYPQGLSVLPFSLISDPIRYSLLDVVSSNIKDVN